MHFFYPIMEDPFLLKGPWGFSQIARMVDSAIGGATTTDSHFKSRAITAYSHRCWQWEQNISFILCFYFFSLLPSVASGFEALKDQNICNKIMVKFIQNYGNIFETNINKEVCTEEPSTLIIFKVCIYLRKHQMPMFKWNRFSLLVSTMKCSW